jgi:hypothetical protein
LQLKVGKLVPSYKHLLVSLRLRKPATKRVRVGKSTVASEGSGVVVANN